MYDPYQPAPQSLTKIVIFKISLKYFLSLKSINLCKVFPSWKRFFATSCKILGTHFALMTEIKTSLKAPEHEYIFSKYSWNLIKNIILMIFWREHEII